MKLRHESYVIKVPLYKARYRKVFRTRP